ISSSGEGTWRLCWPSYRALSPRPAASRAGAAPEEDLEAREPDGLDGEEGPGKHLRCVLADELAPGAMASGAGGGGGDGPGGPGLGDAHVGDLEAELERLTPDASVAPRGVLLSEPQDQLPSLAMPGRTWSWWASGKGGSLATDQLAMPAGQSLRSG